jgi:hypothetical protein
LAAAPGAKWIGTATGILGAIIVAANIGVVEWGFVLWAISSALWATAGWVLREPGPALLQLVFFAKDLVGIRRWAAA